MSPKVPMKLKEMDTVIMHIHLAMQEYVIFIMSCSWSVCHVMYLTIFSLG